MTWHWIKDSAGVHALVDDGQHEQWTRVRGWSDADEPGPTDRVYVTHDGAGTGGPLPFEALAEGFAALGWKPGPPPEPVDITKDPTIVDQQPAARPAKHQTKAAASGEKKE